MHPCPVPCLLRLRLGRLGALPSACLQRAVARRERAGGRASP